MYPDYLIEMSRASLQSALQASTLNMQLSQALLDMSMRLMRVAIENQLGMMHNARQRVPVLVEQHTGIAA